MSAEAPDVVGTVFDEETAHVARSYADALLAATTKTNETDAVISELEEIEADVLVAHPRFAELLASPSIPAHEKDRIITDAFEGKAMPTVVRFLRVLNNHGRLGLIAPVAREARALWDKRQNRRPVTVTTAIALDDGQKGDLQSRVAQTIGATPILTYRVDPSILGGVVIQDGDDLYDASLRAKLQRMR